jgi:hypothetical protein
MRLRPSGARLRRGCDLPDRGTATQRLALSPLLRRLRSADWAAFQYRSTRAPRGINPIRNESGEIAVSIGQVSRFVSLALASRTRRGPPRFSKGSIAPWVTSRQHTWRPSPQVLLVRGASGCDAGQLHQLLFDGGSVRAVGAVAAQADAGGATEVVGVGGIEVRPKQSVPD